MAAAPKEEEESPKPSPRNVHDFSEDEDAPLNDDNLAELREEQGIHGIPEVDVPPEFESDEDIPISGSNRDAPLDESANSLNIHQRSETRQNRNLATGSASSERPFSGKLSTQLSTADALEAAESLDDFEEQERQVQKELESSQDDRYYSSSVQNRQDDFHTDQDIPMDDEYDSDYPDGLGVQMYPQEPPPAYSSPPQSILNVRSEPEQVPYEDSHDSAEDEEDEDSSRQFTADKAGIGGALLAGGMALAGIANASQNKPSNTPERHSSAESYKYNDAIQDHSPEMSARGQQLPPLDEDLSLPPSGRRHSVVPEESPKAVYAMTGDLKALLAAIDQYHVPHIDIEPYLVPFDINFIAAVGDVHPGFGIPRPDGIDDHLGLVVLDEPAGKQSNPTVINMLLTKDRTAPDAPIKKLQRADRNTRQIDQWIENIKEVRRARPPDRMSYNRPMPDIEKLMEEWSPELDATLNHTRLPSAAIDATTEEYADICLAIADIPVHNSRIQSLHLLFSLYNEFKNSQHFRNVAYDGNNTETNRLEL